MSIGIGALIICALVGAGRTVYCRLHGVGYYQHRDTWREAITDGGQIAAIGAALVLVVWFITAVPVSALERSSCRREAAGYGLDYDWSFRNSCRIELPSGLLVPADSIRITNDGMIVGKDI